MGEDGLPHATSKGRNSAFVDRLALPKKRVGGSEQPGGKYDKDAWVVDGPDRYGRKQADRSRNKSSYAPPPPHRLREPIGRRGVHAINKPFHSLNAIYEPPKRDSRKKPSSRKRGSSWSDLYELRRARQSTKNDTQQLLMRPSRPVRQNNPVVSYGNNLKSLQKPRLEPLPKRYIQRREQQEGEVKLTEQEKEERYLADLSPTDDDDDDDAADAVDQAGLPPTYRFEEKKEHEQGKRNRRPPRHPVRRPRYDDGMEEDNDDEEEKEELEKEQERKRRGGNDGEIDNSSAWDAYDGGWDPPSPEGDEPAETEGAGQGRERSRYVEVDETNRPSGSADSDLTGQLLKKSKYGRKLLRHRQRNSNRNDNNNNGQNRGKPTGHKGSNRQPGRKRKARQILRNPYGVLEIEEPERNRGRARERKEEARRDAGRDGLLAHLFTDVAGTGKVAYPEVYVSQRERVRSMPARGKRREDEDEEEGREEGRERRYTEKGIRAPTGGRAKARGRVQSKSEKNPRYKRGVSNKKRIHRSIGNQGPVKYHVVSRKGGDERERKRERISGKKSSQARVSSGLRRLIDKLKDDSQEGEQKNSRKENISDSSKNRNTKEARTARRGSVGKRAVRAGRGAFKNSYKQEQPTSSRRYTKNSGKKPNNSKRAARERGERARERELEQTRQSEQYSDDDMHVEFLQDKDELVGKSSSPRKRSNKKQENEKERKDAEKKESAKKEAAVMDFDDYEDESAPTTTAAAVAVASPSAAVTLMAAMHKKNHGAPTLLSKGMRVQVTTAATNTTQTISQQPPSSLLFPPSFPTASISSSDKSPRSITVTSTSAGYNNNNYTQNMVLSPSASPRAALTVIPQHDPLSQPFVSILGWSAFSSRPHSNLPDYFMHVETGALTWTCPAELKTVIGEISKAKQTSPRQHQQHQEHVQQQQVIIKVPTTLPSTILPSSTLPSQSSADSAVPFSIISEAQRQFKHNAPDALQRAQGNRSFRSAARVSVPQDMPNPPRYPNPEIARRAFFLGTKSIEGSTQNAPVTSTYLSTPSSSSTTANISVKSSPAQLLLAQLEEEGYESFDDYQDDEFEGSGPTTNNSNQPSMTNKQASSASLPTTASPFANLASSPVSALAPTPVPFASAASAAELLREAKIRAAKAVAESRKATNQNRFGANAEGGGVGTVSPIKTWKPSEPFSPVPVATFTATQSTTVRSAFLASTSPQSSQSASHAFFSVPTIKPTVHSFYSPQETTSNIVLAPSTLAATATGTTTSGPTLSTPNATTHPTVVRTSAKTLVPSVPPPLPASEPNPFVLPQKNPTDLSAPPSPTANVSTAIANRAAVAFAAAETQMAQLQTMREQEKKSIPTPTGEPPAKSEPVSSKPLALAAVPTPDYDAEVDAFLKGFESSPAATPATSSSSSAASVPASPIQPVGQPFVTQPNLLENTKREVSEWDGDEYKRKREQEKALQQSALMLGQGMHQSNQQSQQKDVDIGAFRAGTQDQVRSAAVWDEPPLVATEKKELTAPASVATTTTTSAAEQAANAAALEHFRHKAPDSSVLPSILSLTGLRAADGGSAQKASTKLPPSLLEQRKEKEKENDLYDFSSSNQQQQQMALLLEKHRAKQLPTAPAIAATPATPSKGIQQSEARTNEKDSKKREASVDYFGTDEDDLVIDQHNAVDDKEEGEDEWPM